MTSRAAAAGAGQGAIALLAALSLWLQIVVPVVGGTARLLAADRHSPSMHAAHGQQGGTSQPPPSGDHQGHLGLCCIIGGGKLGTGFAPPPPAALPARLAAVDAVVIAFPKEAMPRKRARPVLPVGARAPPRFA
jgi:hypothetical protein